MSPVKIVFLLSPGKSILQVQCVCCLLLTSKQISAVYKQLCNVKVKKCDIVYRKFTPSIDFC